LSEVVKCRVNLVRMFPPGQLSGWVLGMSLVYSDVRTINERIDALRTDDPFHDLEFQYYFRLVCSHLYEAVKLVREGQKKPETRAFIEALPSKAQEALATINRATAGEKGSWTNRVVGPVRNATFHYNTNAINRTLELIREQEPDLTADIVVGPGLLGTYLCYAGEVSIRYLTGSVAEISEAVDRLTDLLQAVLAFANAVIGRYIEEKGPPAVVLEEDG